MKNFKSYYEAVAYLESLATLPDVKKYAKDQEPGLYLKKTKYFLNLIGNPQDNFKFVHITGTSGKGSTANYVHYLLCKNGFTAGLFTSPFATTSIEKIKVNDFLIAPEEFVKIVDDLKPFIDKAYIDGPYGPVSYFEIFFVIALEYFRRKKCEWVVLEVGMGGRYDATNIIEKPVVTSITNIGYDHTSILGNTLTKIAKDKAGIIKRNSIFITGVKKPHLLKILKDMSERRNAKKFIPIKGENEELAIAIATEIGLRDTLLDNAPKLSCRFEIVQKNPLVILDGAHNPSKIQYSLNKIKKLHYKKLLIVIAIAQNKNHSEILKEIAPLADKVFFTRFLVGQRECASPKKLLETYRQYNANNPATITLDPYAALKEALKQANKDDIVFVTGSFFLAGDLRKYWHSENSILEKRKI